MKTRSQKIEDARQILQDAIEAAMGTVADDIFGDVATGDSDPLAEAALGYALQSYVTAWADKNAPSLWSFFLGAVKDATAEFARDPYFVGKKPASKEEFFSTWGPAAHVPLVHPWSRGKLILFAVDCVRLLKGQFVPDLNAADYEFPEFGGPELVAFFDRREAEVVNTLLLSIREQ